MHMYEVLRIESGPEQVSLDVSCRHSHGTDGETEVQSHIPGSGKAVIQCLAPKSLS